jgi:hypothetical protein
MNYFERVQQDTEKTMASWSLKLAKQVAREPSKYSLTVLKDAFRRLCEAKKYSRSTQDKLHYDLRLSAIHIEIQKREGVI